MILIIIIIIIVILGIFYLLTKVEKFNINNNIPKVIYLCYKTKSIPSYIIPNIKKIYHDYEIKLYDNNDCIEFLNKEYNDEYVKIFNFLKDGPIKADFWRICILYKYGGIYCDIDLEHFININKIIDNDTSFVTIKTESSFKNLFNPSIIISKSNNYIIKKCIDSYLEKYKNNVPYEYWEYSIVYIMTKILNEHIKKEVDKPGIYYDDNNNKYQFLLEHVPSIDGAYFEYNNIKICNARYSNYNAVSHSFI